MIFLFLFALLCDIGNFHMNALIVEHDSQCHKIGLVMFNIIYNINLK